MTLIQSLLVIFVIIFIGVISQRRKIFNPVQIEGFELFLFKIAMPCFLFSSTLQHDLTALLDIKYIISYFLTFLVIAGIVSVSIYRTSTASVLCIKILASGYVNTAIYALPIITFLLKDPTAGILGNLVQIIMIQSIFIVLLNFIHHKETLERQIHYNLNYLEGQIIYVLVSAYFSITNFTIEEINVELN